MKETGVIRRLDELGRVVIPKEIRKRLKIKNGDMVDIFTNNEQIVLQRYHPLAEDLVALRALILSINNEYGCHIIIFDDAKVINSTKDDIKEGSVVLDTFMKRIDSYLDKEISGLIGIDFIDDVKIKKDFIVKKIFVDYEAYGYIMVIDDLINKRSKEAISLVLNFFKHIY